MTRTAAIFFPTSWLLCPDFVFISSFIKVTRFLLSGDLKNHEKNIAFVKTIYLHFQFDEMRKGNENGICA